MEKLTARLAEGSEQQKLIEQLKEAINNKWCINFYYESQSFCGYRRVEPYLLGELKNHEVALRGFFVPTREQVAEHGLASGWKLYAIDKIDVLRFEVLEEGYRYTRYGYNASDRDFSDIYASTKLKPRHTHN